MYALHNIHQHTVKFCILLFWCFNGAIQLKYHLDLLHMKTPEINKAGLPRQAGSAMLKGQEEHGPHTSRVVPVVTRELSVELLLLCQADKLL